MTLYDLLSAYEGIHYITVVGYCEKEALEQLMNNDHYEDIRDRFVQSWQAIGGGMDEVEIYIKLENY